MNTDDIKAKYHKIIIEQFGVKPDEVTPEADFYDDLGSDSLDVVELLMTIEETFDIEIPDEEAESWDTVGQGYTYLVNTLASS